MAEDLVLSCCGSLVRPIPVLSCLGMTPWAPARPLGLLSNCQLQASYMAAQEGHEHQCWVGVLVTSPWCHIAIGYSPKCFMKWYESDHALKPSNIIWYKYDLSPLCVIPVDPLHTIWHTSILCETDTGDTACHCWHLVVASSLIH